MKTQVIHLDRHDDLISIRDRMAWAKTPRILLVWPRRGRVDVRPLDLTLLRRHAEALGAELGLVTRNGEIRTVAYELGISIFSTAKDAQKKQWLEQRPARVVRRFPRVDLRGLRRDLPGVELFPFRNNPVRRVSIFAAGVLAVLVVMLVFIPSAEIHITPPDQKQSLVIAVSAAPDIQNVQISGLVPQRKLTLVLEGTDTALATGNSILPDQVASGEALLMNLTDKAVSVPAGTVLLTSATPPVSYITDKLASLPAGKGKNVRVSIRAVAAGLNGNVGPGSISTIDGPLAPLLAVTNPAAIQGGTQTSRILATTQDRDSLKKRLLADLARQARTQFLGEALTGDVLLPSTFALVRTVDEKISPPDGQAGEKLALTLRIEYTMAYASHSDLRLLAERVLNASLPAGFNPSAGTVEFKPVSTPSGENVVHWQMQAQRSVRAYVDAGQVISMVQGKSAARAGSLVTELYGLAQNPKIDISPFWWPWLPFLPIRITVKG